MDVGQVEGPKVPGGMTGGVEFEAMGYLVRCFPFFLFFSLFLFSLAGMDG